MGPKWAGLGFGPNWRDKTDPPQKTARQRSKQRSHNANTQRLIDQYRTTGDWVDAADVDIEELLVYLEKHSDQLNTWEQDFFESVQGFVAERNGLTKKQYDKLVSVAERLNYSTAMR